jgi:tetratricopeptide (TPR) repeat protein
MLLRFEASRTNADQAGWRMAERVAVAAPLRAQPQTHCALAMLTRWTSSVDAFSSCHGRPSEKSFQSNEEGRRSQGIGSCNPRFAAAKQAGAILLGRYDYAAARNLLVLAVQANDPEEHARGWCLLGMCERALGNRDEAITAFRHATAPGAPQDIRRMAAHALAELGA